MKFEIKDYQTLQTSLADFCRFLADLGVSKDGVFDCRLVATELLGNVLRHARATASMHAQLQGDVVELSILSTNDYVPPKTSACSDVYAEHGRGLYLVDSVCIERTTTKDGALLVKIKIR